MKCKGKKLLIAAIVCSLAGTGVTYGGNNEAAVYLKGNDIYSYTVESGGSKLSEFTEGPSNPSHSHFNYLGLTGTDYLMRSVYYSKDNHYVLYSKNHNYSSMDLYYRDLFDNPSNEYLISDFILGSVLLDEQRLLLMLPESEYAIFNFTTKELKPFVTGATDNGKLFINGISKDRTTALLYGDQCYYLMDLTSPNYTTTKFAENLQYNSIAFTTDDLQKIYYYDNNYALHFYSQGKDIIVAKPEEANQKIKAEFTKNGDVYYHKSEKKLAAMDFIYDDRKQADEQMRYRETDGDPLEFSRAIELRNHIRDYYSMGIIELNGSISDVYYFDGNKSRKIASDVYKLIPLQNNSDTFGIVQKTWTAGKKIKMSDIKNLDDLNTQFEKIEFRLRYKLLDGGTVYSLPIALNNPELFEWNNAAVDFSKKLLYYLDDSGGLFAIPYSSGQSKQQAIAIDNGVAGILPSFKNQIFYGKIYNDITEEFTLYMDGMTIDSEVQDFRIVDGILYYFKHIDPANKTGDLYRWDGTMLQFLGEQVSSFKGMGAGGTAFLKDYDIERGNGSLYVWTETNGVQLINTGVKKLCDGQMGELMDDFY